MFGHHRHREAHGAHHCGPRRGFRRWGPIEFSWEVGVDDGEGRGRRRKFDGQVFAVYLLGFAVTRSVAELFRGDYTAAHIYGGLTPGHVVSIGIFAVGIVFYRVLRRVPGRT